MDCNMKLIVERFGSFDFYSDNCTTGCYAAMKLITSVKTSTKNYICSFS